MRIKHLNLLSIIFAVLMLGAVTVYAKGNLAKQEPTTVVITMSEFKFEPKHLEFETGKLYKVIIRNVGKKKHEINAASISHLAYTRKVEVMDKKGGLIAEFKGVPAEIEVGPGYEVEWWFIPIATTDGAEKFFCDLPGHDKAGMYGTIVFK